MRLARTEAQVDAFAHAGGGAPIDDDTKLQATANQMQHIVAIDGRVAMWDLEFDAVSQCDLESIWPGQQSELIAKKFVLAAFEACADNLAQRLRRPVVPAIA